jgi:hypothetical protein
VQILLDGEVGATLLAFGKVLLNPRSVDLVQRAVDKPRQQILALKVRIRVNLSQPGEVVCHRSSRLNSIFILSRALCIRVLTVLTGQSMICAISSHE